MKRFLQTLALLVVGLLVLTTGVNSTLDGLSHSPTENLLTWYSEKGAVLMAFTGERALTQKLPPPVRTEVPVFHRTSGGSMVSPPRSTAASRYF